MLWNRRRILVWNTEDARNGMEDRLPYLPNSELYTHLKTDHQSQIKCDAFTNTQKATTRLCLQTTVPGLRLLRHKFCSLVSNKLVVQWCQLEIAYATHSQCINSENCSRKENEAKL